jgi:hypothetical protein
MPKSDLGRLIPKSVLFHWGVGRILRLGGYIGGRLVRPGLALTKIT